MSTTPTPCQLSSRCIPHSVRGCIQRGAPPLCTPRLHSAASTTSHGLTPCRPRDMLASTSYAPYRPPACSHTFKVELHRLAPCRCHRHGQGDGGSIPHPSSHHHRQPSPQPTSALAPRCRCHCLRSRGRRIWLTPSPTVTVTNHCPCRPLSQLHAFVAAAPLTPVGSVGGSGRSGRGKARSGHVAAVILAVVQLCWPLLGPRRGGGEEEVVAAMV